MDSISTSTIASITRTRKQLAILRSSKRARVAIVCSGVRTDRRWARDVEELGRDDRSNLDLANGIEWMHARRGARMTERDRDNLRSLDNRSWGFHECSSTHMRSLPAWLADQCPERRGAGYGHFLGIVLAAYRAGACGVWIGYAEAMALFRVGSEATWSRWTNEMEELGLIRRVKTWMEDPTEERPRVYGKNLYLLGTKVLEVGGSAELEGATDRGAKDRDARAAAIVARKEQRKRDKERLLGLRTRRSPHDSPHLRPTTFFSAVNTPLRDTQNCNALPSFVGGDTTPPAVGDQKKGATDASASIAVSSGESQSDSRSTAEMLAALLGKIKAPRREANRTVAGLSFERLTVPAPHPESTQGASKVRATECGEVAQDGLPPLTGPLANELAALFSQRRRTTLDH